MSQTQRLTVVESRGFFPFRKRRDPPQDTVLIGQHVLRVADACIDQLRCLPEEYQIKAWELVQEVLTDAERKLRDYAEGER